MDQDLLDWKTKRAFIFSLPKDFKNKMLPRTKIIITGVATNPFLKISKELKAVSK